ncbi:hypothetical protein [Nocardia nepalensis]|uniref:hypothetical protein n=1 Tax=Nocardia nepalensis TaxID=3375448 RepID=UPI003B66BD47
MTTTKKIAIYGATGHTGGYLLTELHRRGIDSYRDSALEAVEVAIRLAAGTTEPGALSVAEAFDAEEFLDTLATFGITWQITPKGE